MFVMLTDGLRMRTQTLEKLRFLIRATEFAFDKYGRNRAFPTWLQGVAWEDYKKPRSKTVWKRLELTSDVALRMRNVDRKITVK